MRIGVFTDTFVPEVNGIVTVIEMMTRELRKEGHECFIFCPQHAGGTDALAGVYRFPSVRFVFYKGLRVAIPYKRHIFDLIPTLDIVHSHTPGPMGLLALWASRRYHIPHVNTYHNLYTEYRRYLPRAIRPTSTAAKWMSRVLCNRCDAIIAPSYQMKQELESYGITRPLYALPFGVDEEEFSHEIEWDARALLNLPTEDLLLYAGRLGMEKNIDFLLRAFKRLLSRRPTARLILAGDGPRRRFLEHYAETLGIAPYVIFTGFLKRRDLIDLYKQCLFVFASKTETQGLVVVEAMMAGAPVVAVAAMGPKDIISSGETGILVNEDENEFALACLRLLEDRSKRQELGLAAQQWARSQSSYTSTQKLLEIYNSCLQRDQTGTPV